MSMMTNYLEDAILNALKGTAFSVSGGNLYAKLHTGAPGEDATSNAAANTTRVLFNLGTVSGGQATNAGAITWTSVPNSETYHSISVWDTVGPAGGNPLLHGALDSPVAVTAGNNFTISAGSLTIVML